MPLRLPFNSYDIFLPTFWLGNFSGTEGPTLGVTSLGIGDTRIMFILCLVTLSSFNHGLGVPIFVLVKEMGGGCTLRGYQLGIICDHICIIVGWLIG